MPRLSLCRACHHAAPLAALTLALAGAASAQTITLDFEHLPDATLLTTQYAGVTFTNAQVLTSGLSLNELEFPPHSGTNVITDNGGPVSLYFSAPITFFGAYVTYAVPLTLSAYGTGGLRGTATSRFSSNEALSGVPGSSPNEFFGVFDSQGLTQVTLTGAPSGGSFTLDDAAYTLKAPPLAVPEPGPGLLLLAGLALIVIWRRRLPAGHS